MPVYFVLAIMEIEAWFLGEHTHLPRINEQLTPALILANLHFDPSGEHWSNRDHPAHDLNAAYELADEQYQKGQAARRTVMLLDCDRIACVMAADDADISLLVETITRFFCPEQAG